MEVKLFFHLGHGWSGEKIAAGEVERTVEGPSNTYVYDRYVLKTKVVLSGHILRYIHQTYLKCVISTNIMAEYNLSYLCF